MTTTRTVEVVLPGGVDDPVRPSGGNRYDRRVCEGLAELGWRVREHVVEGSWPEPEPEDRERLAATLAALPGGALTLLDGLVASGSPGTVLRTRRRLRLVPLVHLPLGVSGGQEVRAAERALLAGATGVVVTGDWTRRWLEEHYRLGQHRVQVAEPGVDPAPAAAGSAGGSRLLCVGAVVEAKGYDVLLAALSRLQGLAWTCVCVGSLEVDPEYARGLRKGLAPGLASRVRFTGALGGDVLEAAYASADLLVLPSRGETYAMVVAEALARGVPVVASRVGGVPATLGHAADGSRPGRLVAPDDPAALATALGRWLRDPEERAELRRAAQARSGTMAGWDVTCARLSRILEGMTAPGPTR